MGNKRLFLDMDGTIARFHDNILDEEGRVQIELMYEPGFFRTLEPFQNMIDAMKLFIAHHPECEVYSLSAAQHGDPPGFIKQKDAWLDEFLPEIDKEHRIYPECGVPKSGYIPGGVSTVDYLIDDFNKNLREWVRDGGKSIKCKNNINHKGLGKFGGSAGNLWTGDMVSNLDSPEEILKQLEIFMSLVREKPFNIYKKFYEDDTVFLDFVGSFEDEKKKMISCLANNGSFLKFNSEETEILLKRIDQVVRSYGNAAREWAISHNQHTFDKVVERKLINTALDNAYIDYINQIDFVRAQIWEYVDAGYYNANQEKFLLEHVNEIADAFNQHLNEWYSIHPSNENISLEVELGCADQAIKNVAEKEMLVLDGYPFEDNYPPVEIDISRRDLQRVLDEVFQEEPWKVEDFLKEFDWDHTDQIILFIKTHPDFFQDTCKVTDFSDAKYAVTITDAGLWNSKQPYKNATAAFYPEKLDEEFAKSILEKGYEGFHIIITDIQDIGCCEVFYDGIVDSGILEDFTTLEKQRTGLLDARIQKASRKCDEKCSNKDKNKSCVKEI